MAAALLYHFWFSKDPMVWFQHGKRYDAIVRILFRPLLHQAERGKLNHWVEHKKGFISLVLLLDQVSRHVYRGRPEAYQNDGAAVRLLKDHLPLYLSRLSPREALFVLLPFQHSTRLADQALGIRYLTQLRARFPKSALLQTALRHQKGHQKVLKRFGRFPKRQRFESRTPQEQQYVLSTPHLPY